MDSNPHEKSSFNPKHLLIDHNIIDFKYHSDKHLLNRHNIDETEKKLLDFISNKNKFKIKSDYEHEKEDFDFLSSKLEAMEKMNLDDECLVEDEIETKKININKNKSPNSKYSKDKKCNNSPTKKINTKNFSPKELENKSNNKNIIIDVNGKVGKLNVENIDLIDDINMDVDKEIKEKESNNFFSSKNTLILIINEIKNK